MTLSCVIAAAAWASRVKRWRAVLLETVEHCQVEGLGGQLYRPLGVSPPVGRKAPIGQHPSTRPLVAGTPFLEGPQRLVEVALGKLPLPAPQIYAAKLMKYRVPSTEY